MGNNEVSTNESLSLDYAWHSCVYSGPWFLETFLEARIERTSLHLCKNAMDALVCCDNF